MDSKKPKKSKSSIPTSSKSSIPKTSSKSSIPTGSKSSSKSKLPSKEPKKKDEPVKKTKPQKVKSPSPEPVNEYEDDFESYESDFEDDVSEAKPVKKETSKPLVASSPELKHDKFVEEVVESEEENEYNVSESVLFNRVNQAKLSNTPPIERMATTTLSRNNDIRPTTSSNRVFTFENRTIPNTEALLQSISVYEKLKSNGQLSHNFIQSVDIPPNRMSDLYNSLIDNSTSSQRYTQTGEDALDNCAQTTPREYKDKANQFPAIFVKSEKIVESRPAKDMGNFATAERFLKFIGVSGRTIISLLALDKPVENVHLPLRSNVEFSVGFAQFSIEDLTKECKPIAIELSCDSEPKVLVGFYIEDSAKKQFIDKSILLEYSFENLEHPINAYLTSDEITDFSYSSDGKSLIFAGQRSGNCLLWDLLNRNIKADLENIPQIELGNKKLCPQLPAYSTSYMLAERKKHAFLHQSDQSIIQTKALKTKESGGQPQFLSLNAGAVVTIWATTRDQFTVNDDLGLEFDSLVRLMKISTNVCATMLGFASAAQVALCIDVNLNDFIVGMSQEGVVRVCRSRQNEQRLRRYNLTNDASFDQSQLAANTVCFSPHEQDYFAIGSSNGSLLIFNTQNPTPLTEIRLKENRGYKVNQLTNLCWSHSHSQIVYALYDFKYFVQWDLSSTTNEPEITDLAGKFASSRISSMFSWPQINNTAYIGFTSNGSILMHELHHSSGADIKLNKIFNIH